MKTFHVSKLIPFEHTYNTLVDAHIEAEKIHQELLKQIPFNIDQCVGKSVLQFIWNAQSLILCFHEKDFLSISIDFNDCLIFNKSKTFDGFISQEETINIFFQNSIEEWNPNKSLIGFQNKKLIDIFFVDRRRVYLYFEKSPYILSLSVLKVKEPPYSLLYWTESI
jgi:hypothetical protein